MIRCIDFGNQLKPGGKPRFGFYEIEKNSMLQLNENWYWEDFYEFKKQFTSYFLIMRNTNERRIWIDKKIKYYFDKCPFWAK